MKTTVDRFGRVVVPKKMREKLGLRSGAEVEIVAVDDHLLLRPVDDTLPLVARDGLLIYTGTATGHLEGALAEDRDERTRRLSGKSPR
jgi:AbrB family looped-hinge helix DNA binding protein